MRSTFDPRAELEAKPLTLFLFLFLVLVLGLGLGLASQLLAKALLLQVEDALLLLLQPAEAPSPEHRVLIHQLLDSHLRLVGAVFKPAAVVQRGVALLILEKQRVESRKGRSQSQSLPAQG